jgi:hypothetical protein
VALSEHQDTGRGAWERLLETPASASVYGLHSEGPGHRRADRLAKRASRNLASELVGIAGLTVFVAAVVALHALRGDLNPAQHTISEYSLGSYGWLMRTAFAALGIGVLATAASLGPRIDSSWCSRLGRLLLVGTAAGLFLDAAYNTDHPRVRETADGTVHGVGMLIICLTLPLASFLLASALLRTPARWRATWLRVLAAGQVVAILGFERSPVAWRGVTERIAVALAVAALALLQSLRPGRAGEGASLGRGRAPSVFSGRPFARMAGPDFGPSLSAQSKAHLR